MRRFDSKVVIVSGATSGIGEATAKRFAAEGANVACLGRNTERGTKLVKEISTQGGEAIFIRTDVRMKQQIERAINAVTSKYEGINILFNNAGIIPVRLCEEETEEEWDDCIDTNLKSTFLLSKYALPWLRKVKGVIINNASNLGVKGVPYYTAYCASKGGVILFTKALAVECAPFGVRVNCICLGPINTPMLDEELTIISKRDNTTPNAILSSIRESVPLRRIASSDEVASLVLYLASEDASFATGAAWSLDGGTTI